VGSLLGSVDGSGLVDGGSLETALGTSDGAVEGRALALGMSEGSTEGDALALGAS